MTLPSGCERIDVTSPRSAAVPALNKLSRLPLELSRATLTRGGFPGSVKTPPAYIWPFVWSESKVTYALTLKLALKFRSSSHDSARQTPAGAIRANANNECQAAVE